MLLKLAKLKDFTSIWREDFLGLRGFFLPPRTTLALGKELEIELLVEGQSWGKVQARVVWRNLHGIGKDATPRGIFLRAIKFDKEFEQQLSRLG